MSISSVDMRVLGLVYDEANRWMSLAGQNVRNKTLSRLLQNRLIEAAGTKTGQRFYRLTPEGKELLFPVSDSATEG